jgi:hypothetical protein
MTTIFRARVTGTLIRSYLSLMKKEAHFTIRFD